jgi:serine/threonine protein kinase
MPESSPVRDPLEQLAEEWRERLRRGEQIEPEPYIERHPELADEIRDLLPAVVMMEELKPSAADLTGAYTGPSGPAASTPGLERLGDFRILREVGRGGMGVVYEAEQESLGRRVALKVLPSQALANRDQQRRFQREARATARLHHTNIVPVYGVGEADGLHYYVMQFIQGAPLDQVLAELKRLRKSKSQPQSPLGKGRRATPAPTTDPTTDVPAPNNEARPAEVARSLLTGAFQAATVGQTNDAGSAPPPTLTCPPVAGQVPAPASLPSPSPSPSGVSSDPSVRLPGQSHHTTLVDSGRQYYVGVARIGIQVAAALEYANSQGIVHRDIKPSNLLLDNHGTVWVTDFGLAKAFADGENLTHTGDIVGTLRYMAPERFIGLADARGDIYSLGLTLYELLVQAPAFAETDRNRLVHQVTHAEPTPPRQLNPDIPRDLETIVLKAIDREPARRYQSAEAMVQDLARFVEDKPIGARRITSAERLWRWCRRNPALAGLAAAVLVLLVVMAVGSSIAAVHYQDLAGQEQEARRKADAALVAADQALAREAQQRQAAVAAKLAAEAAGAKEAEQHQKAVAAQQLAEQNFQAARQAVEELFTKVSEGRLKHLPGMQPLRKELLESALKYYQGFVAKHSDDPTLKKDLADAYARVAAILAEVGSKKEALKIYDQAGELRRELAARDPQNKKPTLDLVAHYRAVGKLQGLLGDVAAGSASLRQAYDTLLKLSPQDPNNTSNVNILGNVIVFNVPVHKSDDPEILLAFAGVLNDKGHLLRGHDWAQAIDSLTQAVTIQRGLLWETKPTGQVVVRKVDARVVDRSLVEQEMARQWSLIGNIFGDLEMHYSGLMYQGEAQRILKDLIARSSKHPNKDDFLRDLAAAQESAGRIDAARNNLQPAWNRYQEALKIRQQRAQDNPAVPDCQSELAECYYQLAQVEARLPPNRGEALTYLQKALGVERALVKSFPDEKPYARALVRVLLALARHQKESSAADSLSSYREARDICEKLALPPHSVASLPGLLAPDLLAPWQATLAWEVQPLAATPGDLFDLAVTLAATDDDYRAFLVMQCAFAAGLKNPSEVLTTPEFTILRVAPEFQAEVQKVKDSAPVLAWMTDVEQAKAKAARENKDLFLYFNGTDWAPHAVAFAKSTLREKKVVDYLSKHFVPVHLDKHMYSPQAGNWVQTMPLLNKYGINNFGTMILADAQCRAFWKTDKGSSESGTWESAEEFISHMEKARAARVERDRLFAEAEKAASNVDKAGLIQRGLAEVTIYVAAEYESVFRQLFELDQDDQLGLRTSYFKYELDLRRFAIRQSLEKRNWAKAVADASRLLEEPGLGGKARRDVYLDRGWANLGLGQFARAAADLARGQAVAGEKVEYALFQVYALIQLGDVPGYRQVCAELLKRHENTSNGWDAFMVAWTCAMAPDAMDDWAPAIALNQRVVAAERPGTGLIYLLDNARGLLHYRAGNLEEAEKAFRQSVSVNPQWGTRNELMLALIRHRLGDKDAKSLLPPTYGLLEPENLYKSGFRDILAYQSFLGEAVLAFPDIPPAKMQMVQALRPRAYMHVGQWDKALAGFTTALEKAPNNSVLYLERARCHEHLKELDEAKADFDKALALKTQDLKRALSTYEQSPKKRLDRDLLDTAYHEVARLQERLGQGDEALATLGHLISLWAGDADRLYDTARDLALLLPSLGNDLLKHKAADLAVQTLSKVCDLRPLETDRVQKDAAWRPLYGQADFQALAREMAQRDKFAVAEGSNLRSLDFALERKPQDEALRRERGRLLARQGHWQRAIADYDLLLAQVKSRPLYWQERGQARVMLQQWDLAAADLTKALDLWPSYDSDLLSSARLAYREIAMWDPVFTRALELRPQLAELWVARARYHLQQSRWTEALADFEHVMHNRPVGHTAWYGYAAAQALSGNLDGYRKTCQKLQQDQAAMLSDWARAYALVRSCHLVPQSGIDSSLLIKVALAHLGQPMSGWQAHLRGATFYRAGNTSAAIALFDVSNRDKSWAHGHFLNWYYLAMIHHQLGHSEVARAWLDRANHYMDELTAVIPGDAVNLFEVDWVEAPLLRQEATRMLGGGKDTPK